MGKPNKYNEARKYILKLQIDIDNLRKRNIELNNTGYRYKMLFKRACLHLGLQSKLLSNQVGLKDGEHPKTSEDWESQIEKEITDETESMDKK